MCRAKLFSFLRPWAIRYAATTSTLDGRGSPTDGFCKLGWKCSAGVWLLEMSEGFSHF